MFLEAILTAIIVSIDGLFLGLAIGIENIKLSFNKLFFISSIPIFMATPIMILGNYFSNKINYKICNYIGFTLFMILSISSLLQIVKKEETKNKNINFITCITIGISIGIDSSISAFSLALNNHNPFITPIYFGVFHGVLIYIGNRIVIKSKLCNIDIFKYISPILFAVIAILKLI